MGRDAVAGNTRLPQARAMPLRCLDHRGENVYAFAPDDAGWAALVAANRRSRHLRTHCCDAPLAAKTSRLGTRFFAHIAGGGCATADESPEHLHLKAMAVAAARANGWTADTEVAGTTPDGEPWRADVLASRGRRRVAVEIQWSPQADDETRRRQARYAAAGVRGLWLFRQPGFPNSRDVPAVRVTGSLRTGLTALGRPVGEILDAAFAGRLRFGLPVGAAARVRIVGAVAACRRTVCGALNRAVRGVELAGGASAGTIDLALLGAHAGALAEVERRRPRDPARSRIVRRSGTATNACFACGAALGPVGAGPVAAFDIVVDAGWAAAIAAAPGFVAAWDVAPATPSA